MVNFLKKIIQFLLKFLTRIYLLRYRPYVIVIAGTANRYWAKEYILEGLAEKKLSSRGSRKHFNAEIGLPLSTLGLMPDETQKRKTGRWLKILKLAAKKSFAAEKNPPRYLVLEMAIDKPNDIEYLLSIVKPNAAVFTAITMIYPENFDNLDKIALEYRKLIKALPENGIALLNGDDQRIIQLGQYAKAKIITYGIENQNADYLAGNIEKKLIGQEFTLQMPEMSAKSVKINRFGRHHIYAELIKNIIIENIKYK